MGTRYCKAGHAITGANVKPDKRYGTASCRQCSVESCRQARVKNGDVLPPGAPVADNPYTKPLRQIEDGYGYFGAITYDATNIFTQCHMCGYFFKSLGHHVVWYHRLSVKEYRQRFGLSAMTPLTAPKTAEKHSNQRYWELSDGQKLERRRSLALGRKKQMALYGRIGGKQRYIIAPEFRNKHGRCPEQLKEKVLALAEELGRVPGANEFDKHYKGGYHRATVEAFGSWKNLLAELGMKPDPGRGTRKYTTPMLIEMLRQFKIKHSREPTYEDALHGNELPVPNIFVRHFGSFTDAKRKAYAGIVIPESSLPVLIKRVETAKPKISYPKPPEIKLTPVLSYDEIVARAKKYEKSIMEKYGAPAGAKPPSDVR